MSFFYFALLNFCIRIFAMHFVKYIMPWVWVVFVVLNVLLCFFWFWFEDLSMAMWHIAMGFLCHIGYIRSKSEEDE